MCMLLYTSICAFCHMCKCLVIVMVETHSVLLFAKLLNRFSKH